MKYHLLTFFLLACASQRPQEEPIIYSQDNPEVTTPRPEIPSITAKQVAAELGSNLVTEIHYQKKSHQLNQKEKARLKELYEKATQEQRIASIQILSWGDKEYQEDEKNQKSDIKLAEARANQVKTYLQSLSGNLPLHEILMAGPASTLSSVINDREASIKKSLEIHDSYKDLRSQVMVIFVPRKQ